MNRNLTKDSKKRLKELYRKDTEKLSEGNLTSEEKQKTMEEMKFIQDQLGYKPIGASDILNIVVGIGTTLLGFAGSLACAGISQHWSNKGLYNKYSETVLNETAKSGIRIKK